MRVAGNTGRLHTRLPLGVAVELATVLILLAGCGSATTQPPPPHLSGGTYVSTRYHFRVSYPDGWEASTGPRPSATIPLTVEITKSGTRQETGSLLSMLAISVLSLSNAGVAASVQKLPSQPGLHKVTLSGVPAYADAPVQQPVPGTGVMDTHADYYLVHGSYEYQLSTDSISNDNAAATLASMLHSFTILP
jgi:hypothetical protein